MRRLRPLLLAPVVALLSACDMVVLAPAGDVAAQQRDLLVVSTLLMLLIIIPVMALIVSSDSMSLRIGVPCPARTPQSSIAVSACASKCTMPLLPGRRTSAMAVALGHVIE